MPYKVLGQVVSTGPSTAEAIYNQILDPSFENITLSGVGSFGAALPTTARGIPGTVGWQLLGTGSGGSAAVQTSTSMGITPAFGKESIAFRQNGSTAVGPWLMYGYLQNTTSSNYTNSQQLDFTTAIPVKPNQTYYFGYNALKTQANSVWTARAYMGTWNAGGGFINSYVTNYVSPTTENVWQSFSDGFNVSSGASYLTMSIQLDCTSSGNGRDAMAIDGVWVAPQVQTTFPNPVAATDTTAPFDTRGFTFKGTPNASETVLTFPGTITDVYTVPAGSSAVVSTVSVANMDINPTKVRIAVVPSGQTLAKKHWITLDAPLGGYSTQTFTIGMTLAAGDKIRVAADNSDTAFTAFGNES